MKNISRNLSGSLKHAACMTLCAVFFVLAGCSGGNIKMYTGASPGKEKLAFIDSSGTLKTMMAKSAAVVIRSVDNNETKMEKSAVHPRLEVLPGEHTLELQLLRSITTDVSSSYGTTFKEYKINKTIRFVAEAGHYYQVYAALDPRQTFPWFTWIEDKTGGRIVAGKRPKS